MSGRMRILGVRRFSRFWWRLLWARANVYNRLFCLWVDVSYRVRPYDMLADRRRWCWRPAQRCGGCWVCEVPPAVTEEER